MSNRHGQSRSDHPAERQNEYFIPGEGILREVIQADICRYLGNDALVRPGNYQGRQGYFIRAYRNLTTEMISDLKEDSRRWASERTQMQQMGYGPAPSYLSSSVHDERQQTGPTPGPLPSQPLSNQPQYGGGPYGGNQGMNQPQYGTQPPYSSDTYAPQSYSYTTGPPTSYPAVSYPYDSNYQSQQPRTAPHTTPYGDTGNIYGGNPYPTSEEYQQPAPYYTSSTAPTTSQPGGYQPVLQPQGYSPGTQPGYNQPDPRAAVRQETRGERRDQANRRHRQ